MCTWCTVLLRNNFFCIFFKTPAYCAFSQTLEIKDQNSADYRIGQKVQHKKGNTVHRLYKPDYKSLTSVRFYILTQTLNRKSAKE